MKTLYRWELKRDNPYIVQSRKTNTSDKDFKHLHIHSKWPNMCMAKTKA